MEIDKFGRFRSSTLARASTIKAENFIIHSKIQKLQRKFEEKHLDKIEIQVNNDEPEAIRIKNIIADGKSDVKDVANIDFVKEYSNSQVKMLEQKLRMLDEKIVSLEKIVYNIGKKITSTTSGGDDLLKLLLQTPIVGNKPL